MTPSPNPFQTLPPQRVLVTGGTGFIGAALVHQLLGAGHTVTALYEVVPAGGEVPQFAKVDELKYQRPEPAAEKSGIKKQFECRCY